MREKLRGKSEIISLLSDEEDSDQGVVSNKADADGEVARDEGRGSASELRSGPGSPQNPGWHKGPVSTLFFQAPLHSSHIEVVES